MKLVNEKEVYERVFEAPDVEAGKCPVFSLRKFSMGEVNSINDQATLGTSTGQIQFLGGTINKMKIKYALVSWKNVTDENEKEVPCTEENKAKLPPNVAFWLEKEIDKLNGLREITKEERKNS